MIVPSNISVSQNTRQVSEMDIDNVAIETLGARDNFIIEKMLTKMIMKGIIVPK